MGGSETRAAKVEWAGNRITELFGVELPVIQAPMAGATTPEMVVAVSNAGGLGSLPAAMYTTEQLRAAMTRVRAGTERPVNLNFFTHILASHEAGRLEAWARRLAPYYEELEVEAPELSATVTRRPFDEQACAVVEEFRPEVVSFHFGLPAKELLERVRRTGCRVIASATTVAEAIWLAERGVDAVIAMGWEAGGHRGSFLSEDMSTQVGTMALVPQVVDAVKVPVIAAGGISDPRGVKAAFALGASAVQVGTAYLFTPEAQISALHRAALADGRNVTAVTNLFTGRPARGIVNRLMREIGPMSPDAPPFPMAGNALGPLRAAAEAAGRAEFSSLWAGQAAALGRPMSSAELTRYLAKW